MIQAVPLSAIRIVLVEPSHPGNIGAVARAMKNMALARPGAGAPQGFSASRGQCTRLGRRRPAGARPRGRQRRRGGGRRGLRGGDHLAAARSEFPRAGSARGRAAHLRDERARARRGAVWRRAHRAHQRGAGARAPADPHSRPTPISLAEPRHGGAARLLRTVPRRRQSRQHAAVVRTDRAAGARRRHGALLRAPAGSHGRGGLQGPHHRRHAT